MIVAERRRQIEEEHYSSSHDDDHDEGELALAAICYAAPFTIFKKIDDGCYCDPWPWDDKHDKRLWDETLDEPLPAYRIDVNVRIRQLTKAGALIAAEIDRLLRDPHG